MLKATPSEEPEWCLARSPRPLNSQNCCKRLCLFVFVYIIWWRWSWWGSNPGLPRVKHVQGFTRKKINEFRRHNMGTKIIHSRWTNLIHRTDCQHPHSTPQPSLESSQLLCLCSHEFPSISDKSCVETPRIDHHNVTTGALVFVFFISTSCFTF